MNRFNGIRYHLVEKSLGQPNVTKNENSFTFNYPCSDTSICTPYRILLSPGLYTFELWGAQGGDGRYQNQETMREGSGGRGAYVTGSIRIAGTQVFYLYIGGKGEDQSAIDSTRSRGGFNGGGYGGVDFRETPPESGAGGGGSTDIRLFHGNSLFELKSRIMVASAGGGSVSTNNSNSYWHSYQGGDGGTIEGVSHLTACTPGTQTTGVFGSGKDGLDFSAEDFFYGGSTGGSGSGYYGGECQKDTEAGNYQESAAGGGSSFISGYEGCDAVKYEDKDGKQVHTGKPLHYSHLFFTEMKMMKKGDSGFLNPQGEPEDGHSGNGCAKITIVKSFLSIPYFCTHKRYTYGPKSVFLLILLNS